LPRASRKDFSFVLFSLACSEPLLFHHMSHAGNRRIIRLLQGCDDAGLILPRAILAEFELAFDSSGSDLEAYDLTEHVLLEPGAERLPLVTVGRLEGFDEFVKYVVEFTRRTETGGAVDMDGNIIPCGDAFTRPVIGG